MKAKYVFVPVLFFIVGAYAARNPQQQAQEILEETRVAGGVVSHVGCNDGKLTAALHADKKYLVHGLDTEAVQVEQARRYIDSLGLYGEVSAEKYDGRNLPYGDNVVNLIVVTDDKCRVDEKEIMRVLAPGGVAWINGEKIVKPRPETIDQWTHYLHDASGNAVSRDKKVGHPRHMQWYAGPRHSRHHDALASMSAMTSSNGRLFYIYDEGPVSVMHRPPKWKLIARDAFNGKLLWKRDIPDWMTHLYNFRAGPKQLPRRLVSLGDYVYVTLGFEAPVVKLDAATGKTLHTYKGSQETEEIIHHDGMLLTVTGDPGILIEKSDGCHGYWEMAEYEEPTADKSIVAYDAESGEERWRIEGQNLRYLVPLSLCALGDNVFYLDNENLHCLNSKTGRQRWTAPYPTEGLFIRSYAPTVLAHKDVIMCLKWNRLCAFSIEDGRKLWEHKGSMGFGSPGDLFAIGDKVWTNPMLKAIWRGSKKNENGIIITGVRVPTSEFINHGKTGVGIDIHTGEITDELHFARTQHHHRCYRDKATERYILLGHSGIQVIDLHKKEYETNRWVRGICQYGIMPANGYIYVPPDPCQCYNIAKINGFFALSQECSWGKVEISSELEKGPAYSEISNLKFEISDSAWPTYRGDNVRSGSSSSEAPAKPRLKWKARIGPSGDSAGHRRRRGLRGPARRIHSPLPRRRRRKPHLEIPRQRACRFTPYDIQRHVHLRLRRRVGLLPRCKKRRTRMAVQNLYN